MKTRIPFAFFAWIALSAPALAADGVHEINQVCALNGGCFPGDAAGFPVQITSSGSYVLTGNLTATGAVSEMIEVGADDVRIDLNNFTIDGGGTCSGPVSGLPVDSCSGGLATTGHPQVERDGRARRERDRSRNGRSRDPAQCEGRFGARRTGR